MLSTAFENGARLKSVKQFVDAWRERGSEKSDAQLFWLALLRALDVPAPENFIQSEVPVNVDGHSCFIDIFIPSTKVLIENKSRGINLDKPARQSDGKFLTPFEQALRYADALPYSRRPRWIVVCNFVELRVCDMDQYHRRREENYQPNIIEVERLTHEYQRLNFLVDPDDENVNPALKISKQAGELVGLIYRSFERGFVALHDVESKTLGRRHRPAHDVRRPTEGTVPTRVVGAPSRTFLSPDLASDTGGVVSSPSFSPDLTSDTGGGLDGAPAGASVNPPFETNSDPHFDKNGAVGGRNAPSSSFSSDLASDTGGVVSSPSFSPDLTSDTGGGLNGAVGVLDAPSSSFSPDLTSDTGSGLDGAPAGASVNPPFETTFDPHTDKNGAVGVRNVPSHSASPDLASDTGGVVSSTSFSPDLASDTGGVVSSPSFSPDLTSDTGGVVSSPSFSPDLASDTGGGLNGAVGVLDAPSSSFSPDLTSDTGGGLGGAPAGASMSSPFEPTSDPYSALNRLCVRLVFCFYAEDAGIFDHDQFSNCLRRASDRRSALIALFDVLNTPIELRAETLSSELAVFPYVNGDLFAESSDIPDFNRETEHWLFSSAKDFNWYGISPTIFGALFESTLNPSTRRTGGMHYTSIENIHRVIDPLFLEELYDEFQRLKRKRKNRRRELEIFQFKLSRLTFLDPACGSGNFLTETYLSLRRLENEVIRELCKLGAQCSILVSIENFYGIEVNDFAVAVARTALWIAENQMMQETEMIIHQDINFLPLTSAAHIVEGNALRLDWNDVVPRVDYIIGNPPFVGHQWRTSEQVADMVVAFHDLDKHGKLDYVCAWYNKAADFIHGSDTRAAFVSTNSICQGESVGILWRHLFDKDIHIDFAHRTFRWISESDDMAAVHCIIVGFSSAPDDKPRIIFDGDKKITASNINGYLLDAPNIFIKNRGKPLTDGLPIMTKGSQPTEGGHLLLSAKERDELLRREPRAEKFIRPFIGAEEFINGKERWCLWLKDATEDELRLPLIAERLKAVTKARLKSKTKAVREDAATPHLFTQIRQPSTTYLLVPRFSSERRIYIPMGYLPPTIIVSDTVLTVPSANLYLFGVMESSVHMAWMRTVCGRLEMRYGYSPSVYNNFPWLVPTGTQRSSIDGSARRILEARAKYSDRSLASLYDPESMPEELRSAHLENDRLVLELYGFSQSMSEAEIVSRLMTMYEARENT